MLAEAARFSLSPEQIEFQRRARELVVRVADEAVQMLGSRGVSRDYPAERWYREVRVGRSPGEPEMLCDAMGAKILRGYCDE